MVTGEDSWESLGLQEDQTSQTWRKPTLNIHWKDWCLRSSNPLATWCEELTHWKDPDAGKDWKWDRGWDGWMASLTRWVWASSGRWWRTRKPDVLQMRSQRIGHNWVTEQVIQRLAILQVHRNILWSTTGFTSLGNGRPGLITSFWKSLCKILS